MKRRLLTALLLILVLIAMRLVGGQRRESGGRERRNRSPEASVLLTSVTNLRCTFSAAATATWEGDGPRAQAIQSPREAVLTISHIDVQDGTAEIGDARGGDNVIVKLVGSTLHFLDISLNGTLGVTTVFARETHDGRLQAVHSLAAYAASGTTGVRSTLPEMAQYYGDCEVGRPAVERDGR
jgi:hypothetical protein